MHGAMTPIKIPKPAIQQSIKRLSGPRSPRWIKIPESSFKAYAPSLIIRIAFVRDDVLPRPSPSSISAR